MQQPFLITFIAFTFIVSRIFLVSRVVVRKCFAIYRTRWKLMKYVEVKKREYIFNKRTVYNIIGRSKGWLSKGQNKESLACTLYTRKYPFLVCDAVITRYAWDENLRRSPLQKQHSTITSQRYSFYWADIARVKVDVIIWWKKTFECTRKGGREMDVTMKLYIIKLGDKRTGSSRAEIFWYRNQNNLCLNK